MLDQGTIAALQTFPKLADLREFSLNMSVSYGGKKEFAHAGAFLDRAIESIEKAQVDHSKNTDKWIANLHEIGSALKNIAAEDRKEARLILESALIKADKEPENDFSSFPTGV